VIAATNRDLSQLIDAGRFREDLYFRLCSDVIHTPTLREQLDDSPEELPALVSLVAGRCLGEKAAGEFVERLARSTLDWIERSPAMGLAYEWPGNFRELEQCVRSVMVRGEYHPPARSSVSSPASPSSTASSTALDRFASEVRAGALTFDELLERYCSLLFARTGNMAETARKLQRHRATVQSRIKPEWVEKFRGR
jgi:DNA-binding NtrC family response regulator